MTDVPRPPQQSEGPATAPEVPDADKPVSDLLADMSSKVSALLRKEMELARVELKDEVRQAAKAGGMLSAGALSGYFSAVFASFGLAWYFDRRLSRPKAFFLVAVLYGAAAAALLKRGREEMMEVDPVPTETVETLKDSVEWAKAQTG